MKKRKKPCRHFRVVDQPVAGHKHVNGFGLVLAVDGIELFIMAPSADLLKEAWPKFIPPKLDETKIRAVKMIDGRENEYFYLTLGR